MQLDERLHGFSTNGEGFDPVDVDAALRATRQRFQSRRRRRRRQAFVGAVATFALVIGGVVLVGMNEATDDVVATGDGSANGPASSPQDPPGSTPTRDSATTPSIEDVATTEVGVFFTDLNPSADSASAARLVRVPRTVEEPADVEAVLENLFELPPDGSDRPTEQGLTTAIPADATVVSAVLDPSTGRVIVDVQGLFGTLDGSLLRNAFAQIVWTATEHRAATEVEFLSDGSPVPAILGDGSVANRPVNRDDYERLP